MKTNNLKKKAWTRYVLIVPFTLAITAGAHAQTPPPPPPPPPSPVEVFNKINPFKKKKKADTTTAVKSQKVDTAKKASSGAPSPPAPPNPLDLFKKKKNGTKASA